jgi:hypothetical protein
MLPTVPLMMWGWIPFTLFLFRKLPPHRAAVASLILGWMFLPQYTYRFPGIPDYSKMAAASIAVLVATSAYASGRFSKLRWEWHDGIMFVWCLTPFFASVDNGLGLYDGVAAAKNYFTSWFVPYVVGRLYLSGWNELRDLAWAIFLGGLVYTPLAAYEIVMSPQLHNKFYGWHPHDFIQSVRGNTYRPVIFMHHGLMVGMWMMAASLVGTLLWRTGKLPFLADLVVLARLPAVLRKIPPRVSLLALLLVFVASKSMGATAMFLQAWIILELSVRFRTKFLILALALSTPWSMYQKINGTDNGHKTVEFIRKYNEDRAASLEYRLINEEMLVSKAMERPVFGWGGWGRSRIIDQDGKDIAVTDAYWVIVLGTTGIVGITCFCLVVLLPPLRFLWRFPKDGWAHPLGLLSWGVVLQLPLYAADCLLNDMANPIYMCIAGGLVTMTQRTLPKLDAEEPEDSGKVHSTGHPTPVYI